MVALIALVIIVAVTLLGTNLSDVLHQRGHQHLTARSSPRTTRKPQLKES